MLSCLVLGSLVAVRRRVLRGNVVPGLGLLGIHVSRNHLGVDRDRAVGRQGGASVFDGLGLHVRGGQHRGVAGQRPHVDHVLVGLGRGVIRARRAVRNGHGRLAGLHDTGADDDPVRLDVGLEFCDCGGDPGQVGIELSGLAQGLRCAIPVAESLQLDIAEFFEQPGSRSRVGHYAKLDLVELRHGGPLVGVRVDRPRSTKGCRVIGIQLERPLVAGDRALALVEPILVDSAHRVEQARPHLVGLGRVGGVHARGDQAAPVFVGREHSLDRSDVVVSGHPELHHLLHDGGGQLLFTAEVTSDVGTPDEETRRLDLVAEFSSEAGDGVRDVGPRLGFRQGPFETGERGRVVGVLVQ